MNLYRYKIDGQLYIIEHLIYHTKYLNNNDFAGIYCYPYRHKTNEIEFLSKDVDSCRKFVSHNFTLVTKI